MSRFSLLLLSLAFAANVQAHAPERHRFNLVTFDPAPAAPTFQLPTVAGGRVRLADFRGKLLLLNFWATWCPPCVRELPSMQSLQRAYGNSGLAVLAVSLDEKGAAAVLPFVRRLGLTFTVALDAESTTSAAYGVHALPSSFLIDPEGRVIAAAKGERDWFSPEARSYLEEVLAGLARSTARR